jgi:hypothetical protein
VTKLKTTPPDKAWLTRLRECGFTARKNYVSSYSPNQTYWLAKLKKKLLSIGGYAVILPNFEPDAAKILTRGLIWRKYKMMKGDPSQCHRNSALLWEANKDKVNLCTGYALSAHGGIWRQHSWCFHRADNKVVETTVGRIAYFGYAMTALEADLFLCENE